MSSGVQPVITFLILCSVLLVCNDVWRRWVCPNVSAAATHFFNSDSLAAELNNNVDGLLQEVTGKEVMRIIAASKGYQSYESIYNDVEHVVIVWFQFLGAWPRCRDLLYPKETAGPCKFPMQLPNKVCVEYCGDITELNQNRPVVLQPLEVSRAIDAGELDGKAASIVCKDNFSKLRRCKETTSPPLSGKNAFFKVSDVISYTSSLPSSYDDFHHGAQLKFFASEPGGNGVEYFIPCLCFWGSFLISLFSSRSPAASRSEVLI